MSALAKIGKKADVVRPYLSEKLPEPTSVTAAIITGSWSMVTDRETWSEKTAQWIRQAMPFDIPLFGVCYGHQLMAHALGGLVADNPAGGEVGIVDIELTPAGKRNLLLDNFPESFPACVFHTQSVLKPPEDCDILAVSEKTDARYCVMERVPSLSSFIPNSHLKSSNRHVTPLTPNRISCLY